MCLHVLKTDFLSSVPRLTTLVLRVQKRLHNCLDCVVRFAGSWYLAPVTPTQLLQTPGERILHTITNLIRQIKHTMQ